MSLLGAWDRWRARREAAKAAVRAEAFWRWFAGVADELRQVIGRELAPGSLSPVLSGWVNELNRRTTAYHPLVRAVVGGSAEEPELVLTPDGDPAGSDHVRALVQCAPTLRAWSIRAFKPRLEMSGCICRVGSVALTPDDVEFAVIHVDNPKYPTIGTVTLLVLFIRGLAGPHAKEVEFAADRLVQSVFGEEQALRCGEFTLRFDSREVPENLVGIPRTPLSHITEILEDLTLGPRHVG